MKELFKNRVFQIIMVTDVVQQLGIWVRNIAVLFFVIEQTNADPVAISIVSVVEYLPMFIFAYIGGTLADQWNPKKTMIWGDYLSAVSILVVMLVVFQGVWQAVFVVTFISTVITQFSVPSSVIMFKHFVPADQMNAAISFSQGLQSIYLIIGPILGTLFYTTLGMGFSLALIAGLFVISATVQFLLPGFSRDKSKERLGIFSEMAEGFSFIRRNWNIKILIMVMTVFCLGQGLLQPLTVFVLEQRLSLGKESLQWFFALAGIGLLIGAGLSAVYSAKLPTRSVLMAGFVAFGTFAVIEVLSTNVFLTGSMYFLNGIVAAFVQVAISAPLIKQVDENMVGRVNGLMTPLLMAGLLAGAGISGIAMKLFGLIPLYFTAAAIMVLCSMLILPYDRRKRVAYDESEVNTNLT
jgi:predicted MFS family arabinose efflux permease